MTIQGTAEAQIEKETIKTKETIFLSEGWPTERVYV